MISSNPCEKQHDEVEKEEKNKERDSRHAQHIDQMLFRQIPLLAHIPLQGRKHLCPLDKRLPSFPLQPQELWGRLSVFPNFSQVGQ